MENSSWKPFPLTSFPGKFDFGHGGSDFEEFLDIAEFIKIAQEEDLFVLVRAGPYICSEWEFGGLPSWLLRDKDIKVRTSDEVFLKYVARFWGELLQILEPLQFTNGGPIIAFQVENEYGNTGNHDSEYLHALVTVSISWKVGIVVPKLVTDFTRRVLYKFWI